MTGDENKPYDPNDLSPRVPTPEEDGDQDGHDAPLSEVEEEEEEEEAAEPVPPGRAADDFGSQDVRHLGVHLARALQDGDYHPVILFGTAFSGKTSLLLSLLTTLISEPRLETGLVLCDPILDSETSAGRDMHNEARKLFEVKTQAFLEGEEIPATTSLLPFFVPVEVRPRGKPAMRFAFLESNGEWYRPIRERGKSIATAEELYPKLRREIEDFISNYQRGMTFLYLTPYTQAFLYTDSDKTRDPQEIESASLAITGVLRAYDRVRATSRSDDQHLMLVTKWDGHSARDADRADGLQEDRAALDEFATRKYAGAIAAFQGLDLGPGQRHLNAYCSGLMSKSGLLHLRQDDELREVVIGYPIRLWSWLYQNALRAADHSFVPLFPQPPQSPGIVRAWHRLLDFVSGR